MKLITIIAINIWFLSTGFSQIQFYDKTSKWYYNDGIKYDPPSSNIGYIEYSFFNDSIIDGGKLLTLSKKSIFPTLGREKVLFKVTDSVLYSFSKGVFDTLYSFSSKIGTGWDLNCDSNRFGSLCPSKPHAIVTAKGIKRINGVKLNYIEITYDFDDRTRVVDTVFELIGSVSRYINPWEGYLDNFHVSSYGGRLRCYHDTLIGDFNNNWSNSCDFILSSIAAKRNHIEGALFLPNPFINELKIESSIHEIIKLEIYDDHFNELELNKVQTDHATILNFNKHKSGAYFIKIQTKKGIKMEKVIKM